MLFRFTLNNDIEGIHILPFNPKGWEDTELVVRRDEKYIGLFFDYTLKLEFFCGAGKEYIDNIFDTQGIEAEITILIEIDCNDSGTFDNLYEGKLNLASYERVYEFPEFTRVNIEQAGIIQTIKTRLDTVVNLNKLETIDGTALTDFIFGPYDLNLHSKKIVFRSEFSVDGAPFNITAFNGHSTPVRVQINGLSETTEPFNYDEGQFCFFNNNTFDRTINVQGRFKFTGHQITTISGGPTPGVYQYAKGYTYRINVYDGSFAVSSFTDINSEAEVFSAVPLGSDFTFNVDVLVPAGHYLGFVYYDFYATSLGGTISAKNDNYDYDELVSFAFLTENSETDPSTAKAFAVYEAGARIAQAITDNPDAFRSHFLGRKNAQPFAEPDNGCGSFMAITNGFQIRKFPLADRPIFISMRDYFDSLNALFNLGLGIEKSGSNYYIRIEPKEFFYSTETLFQIENIRNFTIKSAENLYINKIELGYQKWENEEVNGLDEFNTKRNYTVKLKTVGQSLVQQSKLISSGYAIEFTRRNQYIDSNSTDWKYDNDNFLICLNRSVDGGGNPSELDIAEKNENFTSITNLISPETIYNLRLSPGRVLRSWFKTIAASIIKANATLKDILFSYGEGNYKLTSEGIEACDPANQELVDEGSNVELLVPNTFNNYEPLYVPEIIEFERELSYTQYIQIRSEPTKCLEVSPTNSNFIKGFIQEIRYQPVTGIAQFKLLRAYAVASECSHEYVDEGYVECGYVE